MNKETEFEILVAAFPQKINDNINCSILVFVIFCLKTLLFFVLVLEKNYLFHIKPNHQMITAENKTNLTLLIHGRKSWRRTIEIVKGLNANRSMLSCTPDGKVMDLWREDDASGRQ